MSVQEDLVSKALEVASTYVPVFESAAVVFAELDVFCAIAHAAVNAPIPYVCPELIPAGEGNTIIKQSRHPVLEVFKLFCILTVFVLKVLTLLL